MKRFPFFVCLALLLLLFQVGITSASPLADTTGTGATTAATTTIPDTAGGSVYFETDPSGATIWLATVNIGTSPFTYFSEKTGTLTVHIQKKGYEGYTDTVTVTGGERVAFYAKLTPVPRYTGEEDTPVPTVTTATTIRKSTITVPTPWPTTAESPVDPAVIILAAAIGTGFMVSRRR
jgi:hypothetical protein